MAGSTKLDRGTDDQPSPAKGVRSHTRDNLIRWLWENHPISDRVCHERVVRALLETENDLLLSDAHAAKNHQTFVGMRRIPNPVADMSMDSEIGVLFDTDQIVVNVQK